MTRPWISVIVPTIGRPTLEALLASIRAQADIATVEVLVVADTNGNSHAAGLREARERCAPYGVRYLEHDGGYHAWGHPQRNYGQWAATGEWLLFAQDDNAYCTGAFAAIEMAVRHTWQRQPWLFRVDTWQAGVVWRTRELWLGNVDADCVVVPNESGQLVAWGMNYTSDFDYIRATVAAWGEQVGWADAIIARGRPHLPRAFASPPVAL